MPQEAKKLFGSSAIIFAGTIVGSFFAYLFNMLAGRMLGPAMYGEFAALLSLMMILSVGGGAITTVAMKYSSELYAQKNISALKRLFKFFTKYVAVIGTSLFLISLLFINPIGNYFSIHDYLPIAVTLFVFVPGFLIVVNRGVLQGTQKFTAISITGILESLFRLTIGLILIKLGLEVFGAMAGVLTASVIVYFITLVPIKKLLAEKSKSVENYQFNKKEILNYSWPALMASILLAISFNIDVIMVKHYFDPESAGVYAAISTIAKIILYATGPIVSVMFPMISEKKATGEKHYILLILSLLLTLFGSLIILGVYYIAPGTIIKILYGAQYTAAYPLLPQVGFVILFYALISFLCNYFLAIKNFVFLIFYTIIIIAQMILISLNHSSIEMVIKILMGTLGLLFAILLIYYLFTKKDQLYSYFKGEYEQS